MDSKELISSPSNFFNDPMDIIHEDRLQKDDKLKALENWKQSRLHLQESSGEGMPNNSDHAEELKSVNNAIDKLKSIT